MDKTSATNSLEPSKTKKMLLIAKNYWDFTTHPIVFVAPTMLMAVSIRNRFFRLVSDNTSDSVRVRCLSLCEPDGLKSLLGRQNAAFFFDHTCFERQDLLETAGRMANAIREGRLGEIIPDIGDFAFTVKITDPATVRALENATKEDGGATVPCPWGREDGREKFISAAKVEPTAYGIDSHIISGEAFDELLKFLKKENGPGCSKAAKNEDHRLDCAVMRRASKQAADFMAREAHRQGKIDVDALRQAIRDIAKGREPKKPLVDLKPRHEVDKQRISEILDAMGRYNLADKAIPEEWMDELSDLIWRERDRLGANTEN